MSYQTRHIIHHIHLPSFSPYEKVLHFQQSLAKNVNVDHSLNFLITLEHKPVYTIGLRREPTYNEYFFKQLRSYGAEVFQVDRGGLVTFHGPGQLVAYPVIYLKNFAHMKGVRCYVDNLHDTLLSTCYGLGVPAKLDTENVGVYVGETGKIASIGVQCRRYVTLHGISLNCSTDLRWFDHIVACGLINKRATSLSEQLHRNVTVQEVLPSYLSAFAGVFKCNLLKNSPLLRDVNMRAM